MPVQQSKSGLLAKLGNKLTQAHAAARGKELVIGNAGPPAGIEGGVAQLVDCRIGEYKEGKHKGMPFFIAAAVVKQPHDHNGVPILGLRTQIGPEPLCDTPEKTGERSRKTFAQHWEWFRNQLGILGLDIDQFTGTAEQIESGIVAGMKALVDEGTHLRFRTWKGQKQTTGPYANIEPRVTHEWNGQCPFSENGQAAAGGVLDATPPVADVVEPETPAPDETPMDTEDLDALAAAAAAGDEEANIRLTAIAGENGIEESTVAQAESWDVVVEMIRAASSEEVAPDAEPADPQKGDMHKYLVVDPKTKKPVVDPKTKKARKPVDVEVIAVDLKSKTVTLKNSDDGKTLYKSVPWNHLEPA